METGRAEIEAIPIPPNSKPRQAGHATKHFSFAFIGNLGHPALLISDEPPLLQSLGFVLAAHLDNDNSPSQRHPTSTPPLQSPLGTRILGTMQWGNKLAKLPDGLVIRAWPATTGSPADASTPAAVSTSYRNSKRALLVDCFRETATPESRLPRLRLPAARHCD